MLGAGAAVWSWIGKLPTISSQAAVPASAGIRRALLLELGALALLLPVSIAGTQIALAATTATLLFGYLRGARARLTTLLLPGIGTAAHLERAHDLGVRSVRVATHCTEGDIAAQHIARTRELDMDVAGLLMLALVLPPT